MKTVNFIEIKKDFGADLDWVKQIISIKKNIKYVNVGFSGKESKTYTIKMSLGEVWNNEYN